MLAEHALRHARDVPAAIAAAVRMADAGIAIGEAARAVPPPTWKPPPAVWSGWAP